MTPLRRLLNQSWTFGGGQGFTQPDFWTLDTPLLSTSYQPGREMVANDFAAYVEKGLKANGVVWACVMLRQLVFSEVRFQFQGFQQGRPGPLFGTPALAVLERPSRTETTGELLSRMEQDVSLAGNWFGTIVPSRFGGRRVRRLRPDWVTIISALPDGDLDSDGYDAEVIGYVYDPKPWNANRPTPTFFPADKVAHYSPTPDPVHQWRGMSWLTPVIQQVQGHRAASEHKIGFFKRGTTTNFAIRYPRELGEDAFKRSVKAFVEQHEGVDNAYKTLHVAGGADITPLGADMRALAFKDVQGADESLIAAASGLGAVMAQFSEGMQGSALNAGNFATARSRAEKMLFRPLWRIAAATLERLVEVPEGARLTYDPRDVAFLRDDAQDEAKIRQTDATTMDTLYRANFEPDSIVQFMQSDGDYSVLRHNGTPTVQAQPDAAPTPKESNAA